MLSPGGDGEAVPLVTGVLAEVRSQRGSSSRPSRLGTSPGTASPRGTVGGFIKNPSPPAAAAQPLRGPQGELSARGCRAASGPRARPLPAGLIPGRRLQSQPAQAGCRQISPHGWRGVCVCADVPAWVGLRVLLEEPVPGPRHQGGAGSSVPAGEEGRGAGGCTPRALSTHPCLVPRLPVGWDLES